MPELELTYVRSEVVVQTFTYIKFCTAILQEAQLHRQDAKRSAKKRSFVAVEVGLSSVFG